MARSSFFVDLQKCDAVVQDIRSAGGEASGIVADAGSRAEIERIAGEVGPVDALVLNAAICPWDEDWLAPEWDESFEQVMAVNVLGPIHAARAFLPGMMQRRQGRIVLVGSLAGRMGGLIAGPHYVASKGGVHALVKWLARQAAPHNVLVNGVAPASVRDADDGGPAGRPRRAFRSAAWREPEEIAWPIAFLCSSAASYICGAVLDVNGGVYMS